MDRRVVIVGGGIVGSATALALVRSGVHDVTILEKEATVAAHQTGHNSGVIHAGLYYKPGSLKAETCTRGREALIRFCEEHDVPYDRCGKLVVATDETQLPRLDELERRGKANGLAGITRLSRERLSEYEPHVAGIAGLHVAETGIVDYRKVTAAYVKAACDGGARLEVSSPAVSFDRDGARIVIETPRGSYRASCVVNCAGLQSDRVARLAGAALDIQIVPFRGEYYELVAERRHLVRNLIYPVPDPAFPFLGVHFTRRISGEVEAGPNAVLSLKREGYRRTSFAPRDAIETLGFRGFQRLAAKYWRTGMGEFWRSWSKRAFARALQTLVPDVRERDLVDAGAGVRAQAMRSTGDLVDDFHVVEERGWVHVLNAPSPAATASIAIGETIAGHVRAQLS